ncbi:hypothetical protein Y032_0425g1240 [Ancylostoma ceylanicum]|uniref:Uncharacterized protein n=1 Tax=Ancylostoma ceylanicum TaxID=53326 RepID=A0A016X0V5_9BILA|nr:hypothetical protein Y032_0425g1240 [Ancylostoma ceylanicum]
MSAIVASFTVESREKGRGRGAEFLGRDAEALHACSGCPLLPAAEKSSATQQQTTRASMQNLCVSGQERRAAVRPLASSLYIQKLLDFVDLTSTAFQRNHTILILATKCMYE